MLLKKHRKMRNSIHFLFESTLGDDDLLIPKLKGNFLPHGPPEFPFQYINNNITKNSKQEQIKFLKQMKQWIKYNIDSQMEFLKNIEDKISELKK